MVAMEMDSFLRCRLRLYNSWTSAISKATISPDCTTEQRHKAIQCSLNDTTVGCIQAMFYTDKTSCQNFLFGDYTSMKRFSV